tara:strand:- start:297 stop:1313 length:1017 start_codon:yes stop_codon:yes gene_type:complete
MIDNSKLHKLSELHLHHYNNCQQFKKLIDNMQKNKLINNDPINIFLHSGIFKSYQLITKAESDNDTRLLLSSGTSGKVSQIFADRMTRISQQKALSEIVKKRLNIKLKDKLPFYVVDRDSSVHNSKEGMSANQAAILGFSMFGKKPKFILNNDYSLNIKVIDQLSLEQNKSLIFGFTWKIYKYLFRELKKSGIKLNKPNSILIHGGGWKKMLSDGITNLEFKELSNYYLGASSCINYYGMIEQTGSIYMECDHGHFHVNDYSDVIIRDHNLKTANLEEKGIIQSISLLPKSYPGQSLLTEDVGIILGDGGCTCGDNSKYFNVLGRLNRTALRGCSDVY